MITCGWLIDRVRTDKMGLNIDIVFILNTPIVTPIRDAVGDLIIYSTNHLVLPFAAVGEQFKLMFSSSMTQKKVDMVKLVRAERVSLLFLIVRVKSMKAPI